VTLIPRSNWCADIVAAMTSHRLSRNDATPAAAPASSSAMARPRETRRPRPLGRRKPQIGSGSGFVERLGPRHAARAAGPPSDRHRRAFECTTAMSGRHAEIVTSQRRGAPSSMVSVTDHHHRQLLSPDHLQHGLIRFRTGRVPMRLWP